MNQSVTPSSSSWLLRGQTSALAAAYDEFNHRSLSRWGRPLPVLHVHCRDAAQCRTGRGPVLCSNCQIVLERYLAGLAKLKPHV